MFRFDIVVSNRLLFTLVHVMQHQTLVRIVSVCEGRVYYHYCVNT